jgi:hypothetical protein
LIESLRLELSNKTDEWNASVADALQKEERIKDMDKALINSAEATVAFEQRYIFERQLKEKAQEGLKDVLQAEMERKGGMCDKYTDCVALQRDMDTQTEFLTPGMSVRTVTATGSGTIYKRRPFGVSLVDATEAQQQWDVAAYIKAQDGNRKVGPYAANFAVGTGKGTMLKLSQSVAPGLPISPQDELRVIRTPQTLSSLHSDMSDILDDSVVLSRAGVTRDMVDDLTGEIKQPVLMKVMSVGSVGSVGSTSSGQGPASVSRAGRDAAGTSSSYGGGGGGGNGGVGGIQDQETLTGVGLSIKLMADSEWPAGATAQAPLSRGGTAPFSLGFDAAVGAGAGADEDDLDLDNDSRSHYSASNDSFSLMSVTNEAREAFNAYSAATSSEGLPTSPIANLGRDLAYRQAAGRGPQSQKMVGVFPSSTYEGVSTFGGAEYRKALDMQQQQQRGRDRNVASPIRTPNSNSNSGGGGQLRYSNGNGNVQQQSLRSSNPDINPVDMLELARARLAGERSDRSNSHSNRRRASRDRDRGDEWEMRPISPLKAAGLRHLDGTGGQNSSSSGLKDPFALGSQSMVLLPSSSTIGSHSHSLIAGEASISSGSRKPAVALALARGGARSKGLASSQARDGDVDGALDDRDPAYMQYAMANNLGGHSQSHGRGGMTANVQATAESLSDLKRKFFRQGH